MTDTEDDEQPLRNALGKAIRLRRVELDLTRAGLAQEADVSYTYVSEIENGTKQPSSKTLWRIARALGLEPHELLAAAAQWESRRPAPPAATSAAAPAPAPAVGPFVVADPARAVAAEAATLRSRWFHAARDNPAYRGTAPSGREDASGSPVPSPALVEVLDRIAASLEGVPDERAELALMLTLDERRTRRVVQQELDRRGI